MFEGRSMGNGFDQERNSGFDSIDRVYYYVSPFLHLFVGHTGRREGYGRALVLCGCCGRVVGVWVFGTVGVRV